MRALVEDTSAGAESALELRFLREVERAHGLPPGVRQSVVRRADRRVAVRDVHYPDFAVTVELDGKAHHASLEARLRDQRRDRLAADQGELTLRYAWLDATVDACLSARELGGTLRARGWTGQFHTCPSCERLPVP